MMELAAGGTSFIAFVASVSSASPSECSGCFLRGEDRLRRVGLSCRRLRGVFWAASSVSTSSVDEKAPGRSGNVEPYTGRDLSVKKPAWLRQRAPQGKKLTKLKESITTLKLNTVCEEAQCPNIGEGAAAGTVAEEQVVKEMALLQPLSCCSATLALADAGSVQLPPAGILRLQIPWNQKIQRRQSLVGGYVVLTSVDRDDMPDGGSDHFARTVQALKTIKPDILVECLVSDFRGDLDAVHHLASSGLDVFAHNIETVKRLQRIVRDPRAGYDQSIAVLKHAKTVKGMVTKSSIMLGLGERDEEIKQTMLDLRAAGVDIFTLGQYLQPTPLHLTVKEYVTPEKFEYWKQHGESIGFRYVASGLLVRSSCRAGEFFIESMIREKRTNAGL